MSINTTRVGKFVMFWPVSHYISEILQDGAQLLCNANRKSQGIYQTTVTSGDLHL